ncbi:hypothetical protein PHYBOEH_001279 [Phytophthora boehmeriae]|uniref:Crinkler (CRN) family protein n=1 Tax=Phytophthora boehmeriae TaxID=109152 RepID=A0A8T1WU62_9STRA|nr:hypothetical protein PHYBOEH_001279 [Phytophthora boehmeriae]
MPIEASFSWRLLYRFFLDNNCSFAFDKWFKSRLPRNGDQLTLSGAIEVIERKLREKRQEPATLYLFLGVDEYQKIEKIGARQKDSKTSLLRELVEVIADLLCLHSSSLVLLPMFAGTDLGVIASGSIANSSYYVTKRLPMNLLTLDQVFSIVEGNATYAELLTHTQICRDLFVLGGVPRVVVFVDQRKRQFGKFQPSHARDYLGKLTVCPDFLVASGARLVRGIMNSVALSNLAKYEVPHDCFILSRNETEHFHGTLAYHPACSPVVCINSASRTALKTVFEGDAGEVDETIDEIMRKRPSGGCTSEELQAFTKAKRLKVKVDDMAEFSS